MKDSREMFWYMTRLIAFDYHFTYLPRKYLMAKVSGRRCGYAVFPMFVYVYVCAPSCVHLAANKIIYSRWMSFTSNHQNLNMRMQMFVIFAFVCGYVYCIYAMCPVKRHTPALSHPPPLLPSLPPHLVFGFKCHNQKPPRAHLYFRSIQLALSAVVRN